MKQILSLLCMVLLLAGCSQSPAETTVFTESEIVTGVATVPEIEPELFYSPEMAMIDGCLVMDEGDVQHNIREWLVFLKKCQAGEQTEIAVVQYTQGESGSTYVKYDLSFDGAEYSVKYEKDGAVLTETASELTYTTGLCDNTMAPYDSFERYSLNDIVLYEDLIAEPDYEGVREIFLHAKEGEPAVKAYMDAESVHELLELLSAADYVPCEPENHIYGMKLLMTNRDGKQLVIELDLNQGVYRYGMQNYEYGTVSEMLGVLGIDQWPESVLNEFSAFLS